MGRPRKPKIGSAAVQFTKEFTSITGLLDYVFAPLDDDGVDISQSEDRVSLRADTTSAHGTSLGVELTEARRLLEQGWPEGVKAIEKYRVEVSADLKQKAETPVYDYDTTGLYLDIDSHIQGQPECWIRDVGTEVKVIRGTKVISLYYSVTYNAMVTQAEVFSAGGKLLAVVDAIEAAGVPCEVFALNCVSSDYPGDFCAPIVKVKNANEPLDIDKMAFILCNVSFKRRLLWAVEEHLPKKIRSRFGLYSSGGYGHPTDFTPPDGSVCLAIKDAIKGDDNWVNKIVTEILAGIETEITA